MSFRNLINKFYKLFESEETKKYVNLEKIISEEQQKLENGEEILPPWIVFSNSSPFYGWNQGFQELWKDKIWHPFWQNMNENDQELYFLKYEATPEWRETITSYWYIVNVG